MDIEHLYLTCRSCNAYLSDILLSAPAEEPRTRIVAGCPWCGDRSFETVIKGGFHPGGYGTAKEDDETDDVPSTRIECVDEDPTDTERFLITLVRAGPEARAVYHR